MKKLVCAVLSVMLLLSGAVALAQSAEELLPDVPWTFAISLTDLQSPYAILVNADNMLDEKYAPATKVKVSGIKRSTSAAVYLEEKTLNALKEMFKAASEVKEYTYLNDKGKEKKAIFENGIVLYVESGYRSFGTQTTMYANRLAKNNNVDDGFVAKPGASEHQTGLCADVINAEYAQRSSMTQDFKNTPEAYWMKENCAEFGFILRFPEGEAAEKETGIRFEPWHFRYVGKSIAEYVMGKGITYEAFIEEAREAMEQYEADGGDLEQQLAFETYKLNMPPMSFVLDAVDEEGDAEVSLVF